MRRKPLVVAMLALLSVALVLGGNALLEAGWGPALRSVADRVLPNPEVTMWAPAPIPGSHASSYADATGAGTNYVYRVTASDAAGNLRELQLIFFGGGVGQRGLARDRGPRRVWGALPGMR